MAKRLKINNHKEHWCNYPIADMVNSLEAELIELIAEVDKVDDVMEYHDSIGVELVVRIIHEASDVANYAMMVADLARHRMDKGPTPPAAGA
jgi:hypothetical protein